MTEIPDGFAPHFRKGPAHAAWEPLYSRWAEDGALVLGFRVGEQHANLRGLLHGGVIATLCDNAMGLTYAKAAMAEGGGIVTVSLNVDYLDAGRVGDWVEVRPRLLKGGKSMGFVDALVVAGDKTLARASATFRNLAPESRGPAA